MSSIRREALDARNPHAIVAYLHQRYARQIHRFCRHQLRNREEAEDATQLTFINALRALERGASLEFESAWLFTIAQNVCLNTRRSTFRRRRVETASMLQGYQEGYSFGEWELVVLLDLDDALQDLPDVQRRAILLREWRGLSYKEIAVELELSQAAVETLLFRARRSLAARLVDGSDRPSRFRHGDLGLLAPALKGLLAGAAPKIAVTAAAVVAASVVGVSADSSPASASRPPGAAPRLRSAAHILAKHEPTVGHRGPARSAGMSHDGLSRLAVLPRRAARSPAADPSASRAVGDVVPAEVAADPVPSEDPVASPPLVSPPPALPPPGESPAVVVPEAVTPPDSTAVVGKDVPTMPDSTTTGGTADAGAATGGGSGVPQAPAGDAAPRLPASAPEGVAGNLPQSDDDEGHESRGRAGFGAVAADGGHAVGGVGAAAAADGGHAVGGVGAAAAAADAGHAVAEVGAAAVAADAGHAVGGVGAAVAADAGHAVAAGEAAAADAGPTVGSGAAAATPAPPLAEGGSDPERPVR